MENNNKVIFIIAIVVVILVTLIGISIYSTFGFDENALPSICLTPVK